MMAHLLVFDDTQISRKELQSFLDRVDEVENWYAFFGNVSCLASTLDAGEISSRIRFLLPHLRFIITTLQPTEFAGFMPKTIWEFVTKPEAADVEVA